MLAALAGAAVRSGRGIRIPGFCLLFVAWPALQLVPLGSLAARLEPQRIADTRAFLEFGIEPRPVASLYPYATAHAWLIIAGSVAIFLLAKRAGERPRALDWLALGVIILAWVEIIPALRQWLQQRAGIDLGAASGVDSIHGTFANRNLLAAWLEGCYGVALNVCVASFGPSGAVTRGWKPLKYVVKYVAAITAFGCAAVVAASLSRMGALAVAGETVLVFCWNARRRRAALPAGIAIGAVVILVSAAGILDRFSRPSLAAEKTGRLAMWADSLLTAKRYPVLGAGAGCFPFAFRRSHPYLSDYTIDHPHNEYLENAVEYGVPFTVVSLVFIAIGLGRCLRRAQRMPPGRREIALGCLAGIFALLMHAGVDFPLRVPAILGLLSTLAGIAFSDAASGEDGSESGLSGRKALRWSACLTGVASAGAAAFAIWSLPPASGTQHGLEEWNADAHYRAGRADLDERRLPQAEANYRRALLANPYAAALWNEMALAAEERGEPAAR
jgi:O-antigen ligase